MRSRKPDSDEEPDWLAGAPDVVTTAWSSLLPERWRAARVDPGRAGVLALAAVAVVVVAVAAVSVLLDSPTPAPVPPLPVVSSVDDAPVAGENTADASGSPDSEPESVVSVVGLVVTPGLVRLRPGSRIADAVAAAGGPVEGADLLALNMAARVADGDQIVLGLRPSDAPPPVSSAVSAGVTAGASGGAVAPGAGSGEGQSDTAGGPVDLNSATVAELDALPGIGPVTAGAIAAWREVNGSFGSVDQLAEVDGIGPGRMARIRDLVSIG